MLVHVSDLEDPGERVRFWLAQYIAICKDSGVVMLRSDGRRKSGRNSRYWLRFPDSMDKLKFARVGCTAPNDDEAIRKLQPRLNKLLEQNELTLPAKAGESFFDDKKKGEG